MRFVPRAMFALAVCLSLLGLAFTAPARSINVLAAGASLTVYDDALGAGWNDWSWSLTDNLANTSPAYAGTHSLSVQYTAGWDGLQLSRNGDFIDGSLYDTLRFWIHGGSSGGQQINLFVQGGGASASVVLNPPAANTWRQVNLSLSQFGSPAQITTLVWQNNTAGAQATFYLDNISLVNSGLPTPTTPAPGAGPALSVNAGAGQHAISPDIYGLNFADASLAADIGLPVNRWGGNATTRYNWQLDIGNHASDWYFENIDNANANPGALPNGSSSDKFVSQNRASGTDSLLTLPLIGWTPKGPRGANPRNCGFPTSLYPSQQAIASDAPCGNGLQTTGAAITGNSPLGTSFAISPTYDARWVSHLVSQFGAAGAGGVRFYDLDNEPGLWNSTHRDVHPQPASYDELTNQTLAYAPAIKAADPGAKLLGPVPWGWTEYFYSALDEAPGGAWWNNPLDRLAHGNVPWVEYYLKQMRAYEQAHGQRLLDYLDVHFYPQESGVALASAGSATTQALRLRSTRALWDSAYLDESWINDYVQLIPRLKTWVANDYPGTKLAISEYNWGALDNINGAVTQADVLGIFGREGLDLATLWAPPAFSDPGAFAFRMYRNYDGAHSQFGSTSVQANSTDQSQLAVYAARRAGDGALTILVLNKSLTQPLNSQLTLAGFVPAATAAVYRYSAADLGHIVRQSDQSVTATGFSASFPAQSITLFVLLPGGGAPTATATASGTATRSPTPTATRPLTPTPGATSSPVATPTTSPTRAHHQPTATPSQTAVPSSTNFLLAVFHVVFLPAIEVPG